MTTITKFVFNGIKHDGKLYKAHYSEGPYVNLPEGTITIYAKECIKFPQIRDLAIENESDMMTDYSEKDRIRVQPSNKYYEEVLSALRKQEERTRKAREKQNKKSA